MQWLERHVPKLVLAPSFIAALLFVYGFIGWTAWVSFTRSRLLPNYDLVGTIQYERLFASPRWEVALNNLFVFGVLFIGISMLLGLLLAIFLDQKIRTEGVLRTIYLYPMALSLIVTGTAWKWMLNPGLGLEAMVRGWGFGKFPLRLDHQPRHGNLHRGHRRGLAGVGLRDGAISGRAAIRGWRDHKGRAGRWHPDPSHLYRDHHSKHGADFPIGIYRAVAFGDQKL